MFLYQLWFFSLSDAANCLIFVICLCNNHLSEKKNFIWVFDKCSRLLSSTDLYNIYPSLYTFNILQRENKSVSFIACGGKMQFFTQFAGCLFHRVTNFAYIFIQNQKS